MKKLTDELKNLNNEYIVSKDFRKKVMAKIHEEGGGKSNIRYFYKYTSVFASAAAVIILCVIISKNGQTDSMDSNGMKYALDAEKSREITNEDMLLSQDLGKTESMMDMMITMEKNGTDIESILIDNNVAVIEKSDNYLIVEKNEDELKKILEGFDCKFEVLEENKIKITF